VTQYSEVEATKQLRLDYARRTLVVAFPPGSAVLSPAEAARLVQFLGRGGMEEGDRVALGAGPASGTLGERRMQAIATYLRTYGVIAAVGSAPPAALVADQVLVDVGRYVVTTPSCPNWSRPSGPEFTNSPSSNFGCATATNLGLMVADPGDLLAGRGHGATDGEPATLAVQRYRTDHITPLNVNTQLPVAAGAAAPPPSAGGSASAAASAAGAVAPAAQ
jgi:pilus assembly protein CpaD